MLLGVAIIRISRDLENLLEEDGKSISSHSNIKEKGLKCLLSIFESAPDKEFINLIESCDNDRIIIGYLLNVLCKLSKFDKSREVRINALEAIGALIQRLERIHVIKDDLRKCSIVPIITALPGVSSTLFQVIMSDTKLPRSLLTIAIKTLTKLITTTFLPCSHDTHETDDDLASQLIEKNVINICDNLSTRINLLINYITTNSNVIAMEVKSEILNLCSEIVNSTHMELLTRTFQSIISYVALINSTADKFYNLKTEVQLKVLLVLDNVREKLENLEGINGDGLNEVVFKSLLRLLDNLENEALSMLDNERKSQLSMLIGFMDLLPEDSLSSFIEMKPKRDQVIRILVTLTEFSSQQPILFLTDTKVNDLALEMKGEKIYTVDKRFSHIDDIELDMIIHCCRSIGQKSDFSLMMDVYSNEFVKEFSNPSNLFVASLILRGFIERKDIVASRILRFTNQMINFYVEQIQDRYTVIKVDQDLSTNDLLTVVIAIETLVILIDMHLHSTSESDPRRIVVLKDLICPLLNWCSSSNRAISEASLNSLTRICSLYGHKSNKEFIEQNTDYIVDGVMKLLNKFVCNAEITNVLAITFKLSSISTFYYFKDVYEKVFQVLGAYQFTDKSKLIALLFYRTLLILNEWKEASRHESNRIPLITESSIKSVAYDLDIDRRIKRLRLVESRKPVELEQFENEFDQNKDKDAERTLIEDLKAGRMPSVNESDQGAKSKARDDSEDNIENKNKKKKSDDIVLAEKILHHCIALMMSPFDETKIYALKAAACGFNVLNQEEDILLPLVHKLWSPLTCRLNGDYSDNLEINLCAFECLISMANSSKDFIKKRTLDSVIPRLCLFLETQSSFSRNKKNYGPYCMTMAYKCQLKILAHLGELAYHLQINYNCLWRIIRATLVYLDSNQVPELRQSAQSSLHYLIALDADCVWYYAKRANRLDDELKPLKLLFEI